MSIGHRMRSHMRSDGKRCGYTTPDVGGTCRKCGCLVGETLKDDVPYVRPDPKSKLTGTVKLGDLRPGAKFTLSDVWTRGDDADKDGAPLIHCTYTEPAPGGHDLDGSADLDVDAMVFPICDCGGTAIVLLIKTGKQVCGPCSTRHLAETQVPTGWR
jgi:hypothetical protein